jgi:hypothetical protein
MGAVDNTDVDLLVPLGLGTEVKAEVLYHD